MKDSSSTDSFVSKAVERGLSGIFLIKTLFTAVIFPASITLLSFIKSFVFEKIILKITGFVVAHRKEIASFFRPVAEYLLLILLTVFMMLAFHLAVPEISSYMLTWRTEAVFAWLLVMGTLFLVSKPQWPKYQKVLSVIIALLVLLWFVRMG